MIDKLKEYYHNNNRQLKLIKKFIYKPLNRPLRTKKKFNHAKAIEYFKKALKNERKNPMKANLIPLIQTCDNMRICLCYENDVPNGLEYRLRAIEMIEKVYPRTQFIFTIDDIGDICFTMGMYDDALECFRIDLNIKQKCLPINDVSTAKTRMNIGDIFIEKEKNRCWKSNEQYKIKVRSYYVKA
jgi:tetratricopeptide (TPR) repeat protein